MFHEGSADEVHELKQVRRRFQTRYHGIVSLEEIRLANPVKPTPTGDEVEDEEAAEEETPEFELEKDGVSVLETFLRFLRI